MTNLGRAFEKRELHDPGFIKLVFGNTYLAPLWTLARLYLGYQWLLAGSHKVWGDNRWIAVSGPDGLALKGFWTKAVAVPQAGAPPIAYDWYRHFLTFMLDNGWYHWFAWVIALGEVTVGIMLIVGGVHRVRGARRRDAEFQLHACRVGQHQPRPVHHRGTRDVRVEGVWMDRPRPLAATGVGDAVGAGRRAAGGRCGDGTEAGRNGG